MADQQPYVLLVDDDERTNMIHRRTILKQFPEARIESVTDGRKALRRLLEVKDGDETCPTHIWLDLSMPTMDGWSFLDALAVNAGRLECRPTVTIVSSSQKREDRERAQEYPVAGFVDKHMSVSDVDMLLNPN